MTGGQAAVLPDTEVLLPLRTTGAGVPLFCVHPLSGLGWCYAGLLPYLGRRPVYCLQARRPPACDLPAMVAGHLASIREVQPDGPYQLMGWSAGGSIAHAVACGLQREGADVGFLALLDSFPSTGSTRPRRIPRVTGSTSPVRSRATSAPATTPAARRTRPRPCCGAWPVTGA
ncbi:thioesterase domain-containing protein [Nonomuraea rubra]|uniref:thioesterase domain-containing protein n=1 Tax=Nonomuraea rubra TaxID=46180 RepID=UPI0036192B81